MADEYIKSDQPDLSALLSGLLQNPAAISMLSSLLAGGLGSNGSHVKKPEPCDEPCPKAPPLLPPCEPPHPKPTDDRACLLNALRPYLSPARCETIDSLLRILELMELLRKRR